MKKTFFFVSICALAAMSFVSCSRMSTSEKQLEGISKSDVDSVSYMLGYNLGMSMKYNNMGPMNLAKVDEGIKAAMEGVEISQQEFYAVVNGYMEKRMKLVSEANEAASINFIEDAIAKEGAIRTESGLVYKIVAEGGAKATSASDTVEVNYEGRNLKGEVFDSSYERGESVTFPLNHVIKGWTEGMQLVGEGGEIHLWIPSDLAYGDRGQGDKIGPKEALFFKVEVLKVMPKAEAKQ